MNILKNGYWDKIINFLTPEVIVGALQYPTNIDSNIFEYYTEIYNISPSGNRHPIFKTLINYTLMNGSISDKNPVKGDGVGVGLEKFAFSPGRKLKSKTEQLLVKTNKELPRIVLDDNVWQLLDEIQKKFIGQEEAAEGLFYNIVNNQMLANMEYVPDGQRSIIFMDGPSGTGKTAITREITKRLGIPFTSTSVTNYSSTGYVGGNLTDILSDLFKKANCDLELAQKGIVVLDEFDKIAYSRSGGLEMKRAVQQQLLDFLGGGKYNIRIGDNVFDMDQIEFDTSKLTFICLGALTDLRSKKTARQQTIGFGQSSQTEQTFDEQTYSITPDDLISIGLEKELVGRLNTYLHTDDYSVESLEKILRESDISPLKGFEEWVNFYGKKLVIDDDVYRLIAEHAYKLNTGARSLQTVMNGIRTFFMKTVMRGTSDTIHLDAVTVSKVNEQTTIRKRRR